MKEAIRVGRTMAGKTSVTVTLTDDNNRVVRWTVRTFQTQIKAGLDQARREAKAALAQLEE